jgi:hypothetical protein
MYGRLIFLTKIYIDNEAFPVNDYEMRYDPAVMLDDYGAKVIIDELA